MIKNGYVHTDKLQTASTIFNNVQYRMFDTFIYLINVNGRQIVK